MSTGPHAANSAGSVHFTIAANAPWVDGHFPGNPILPGAHLLDHVIAVMHAAGALATPVCQIAQARFSAVVRPGSKVDLSWQPAGQRLKFECRCEGVSVASGHIAATVPATTGNQS